MTEGRAGSGAADSAPVLELQTPKWVGEGQGHMHMHFNWDIGAK